MLGFAVITVAAMLILRFTGRRLGTGTAIVTVSLVATIASLARMAFDTGAVTLLTTILLVCVFGYHSAPAMSRWLSGIRLPVFPSATSRWVFEARPDLPTTVAHGVDGGRPTLEGPASIQDVVLRAERARSFLTGLLVGLGVLTLVSLAGVSDPHTHDRWLPLLLVAQHCGLPDAARPLLRRPLAGHHPRGDVGPDRRCGRGALFAGAVLDGRCVGDCRRGRAAARGGTVAAATVPNTIYSPLFRKLVEQVEYLCLMPIFPLALWLMNVYAAIRYR